MKSPPRTSKADGRRRELIAAASRVLLRGGAGTASVRAVADEAQVSVGSVLYYFDSFDELLRQTMENVLEEFYGRRLKVIAAPGSPAQRLARMIELGVPDEISEDLGLLYGSLAFARTNPQLQPLHRSIVERQVDLYRTLIEVGAESGDFGLQSPAEVIARNLVALEDAYDLYALVGIALGGEQRRAQVRSYAELALGCRLPAGGGAA